MTTKTKKPFTDPMNSFEKDALREFCRQEGISDKFFSIDLQAYAHRIREERKHSVTRVRARFQAFVALVLGLVAGALFN